VSPALTTTTFFLSVFGLVFCVAACALGVEATPAIAAIVNAAVNAFIRITPPFTPIYYPLKLEITIYETL
jgi:hypothetical protein